MNDHKEHISQYSAADIQRYVQGKLSAAEMHAMEKAALDDPFLADAIEGYQQAFDEHKESLVTGQLQQLQQQFNARTNRTARVVAFKPFRYWQAAAAAVVFIITGVWLFSLNKNEAPDQSAVAPVIAKTEQVPLPQQQPAPSLADSKNIDIDKDSINTSEVATNTHHWHNEKNKVVTEKPKAPAPKVQDSYSNPNFTTERASAKAANPQLDDANKYFAQAEK